MKRVVKIIIIIVVVIILLLLFVKLTGMVIKSVGTSINTCFESDNGKQYWVKGEVHGTHTFLGAEEFYEVDKCEGKGTLIEYYCILDDIHSYKESEKFDCPDGCENGKCLGKEIEVPEKISLLNKIKRYLE